MVISQIHIVRRPAYKDLFHLYKIKMILYARFHMMEGLNNTALTINSLRHYFPKQVTVSSQYHGP